MHINKSHRVTMVASLYKILIARPRQEWEDEAKSLLSMLYARWYKEKIKPHESSPLFQFLGKAEEVAVKDISANKKETIRFILLLSSLLVKVNHKTPQ